MAKIKNNYAEQPLYITEVDALKTVITGVKFKPYTGYVFASFSHDFLGKLFDLELQFQLYSEREKMWVATCKVLPCKENLIVTETFKNKISRTLSDIFGPMMARCKRGAPWL